MTNARKVLVIAHAFPPMGGIAVQRPLKLVRYLRPHGWEPVVLTTRDAYSATMDYSLLEEIPEGVEVVRVKDPVARLIGRMVQRSAGAEGTSTSATHGGSNGSTTATSAAVGTAATLGATGVRSWASILKRWLKAVKEALFIPDESVFWAIKAAWVGARLVRKHQIQCIYTTSGPHSTHLAGWLIRRWTGVEWIADFRDPWVGNLHYSHEGLRDKIERWLEGRVFRAASRVVTVTDLFAKMFVNRYPFAAEKVEVIRNGVDPSDFPVIPSNQPSRQGDAPFTFFYAGILYPRRSPARFLQALHLVLRSQRIRRQDIKVEFAGVFDYPGQTSNADLVRQLGLSDVVTVHGYMPRSEVIRRMQSAGALLLIGDDSPSANQYVPGKLYEYLFADRPVLALLQNGEASDIIRAAEAGVVVSPHDLQAIANAIVDLYIAHKRGVPFTPNRSEIMKYSRVEQTRQFAELFNRVVGSSGKESGQGVVGAHTTSSIGHSAP
jgi:glycosyltransferase involved in cell wall biosynthesis